jgi:hypothetical protein
MAIATFKDLCIDAGDALVLGEFWASALGLELHRQDGGDTYLTGPTPEHTIWVNAVPEPKSVKHRMHLDVNAHSLDELTALGATVVDDQSFRWALMNDPEGGEFCAFVRTDEFDGPLLEVILDTGDSVEDSHGIAAWWAEVLGADLVDTDHGYSYVEHVPGAPFGSLDFIPVPEPKAVKNRIHLDVTTSSVEELVGAGATVLRPQDDEIGWTVMADPDGNEFCAFTS